MSSKTLRTLHEFHHSWAVVVVGIASPLYLIVSAVVWLMR